MQLQRPAVLEHVSQLRKGLEQVLTEMLERAQVQLQPRAVLEQLLQWPQLRLFEGGQ